MSSLRVDRKSHRASIGVSVFLAFLLLFSIPCESQSGCSKDWAHFSAPTVSGEQFEFSKMRGTSVLLAFLDIAGNDVDSASRAQSVVLQSLDRQYGTKGIKIVAMDSPVAGAPSGSRHSDLVNGVARWHLQFSVLEDIQGSCLHAAHIHTLPTMVLISAAGEEIGRWEGYTRTPILAQAIERLVGGPLGSLPDAASRPESIQRRH